MSWYKIKRDPADKVFSDYIRTKANWKCEKCGKLCRVDGQEVWQLEASHYHSRGHENTRFDEENVYALCSGCHRRMGGHRKSEDGEYDLWVKEKLGEEKYMKLLIRANTYCKKDRAMSLIQVKLLLKTL